MSITYYAADYAWGINPTVESLVVQSGSNAAGVSGTLVVQKPSVPLSFGRVVNPIFNTNASVNIDGDTAVAVAAVSTDQVTGLTSVTLTTPTHAHGKGSIFSSGTVGLQEAINDATLRTNGGVVIVDSYWTFLGGTSAMIAAATLGSKVSILDMRGPGAGNGAYASANSISELMTLSTSGATTDSSANLLPANSLILAVTAYVTETVNNVSTWQLGDSSTAGRFSGTQGSGQLLAGASLVGGAFKVGTGLASASTGAWQGTAATLRITTAGGSQNTTGKIRVTVFYQQFVAPTS